MANKSRIVVALPKIIDLLIGSGKNAFTPSYLEHVFDEYKDVWRLPLSMDLNRFIKGVSEAGSIPLHTFSFEGVPDKRVLHFEEASIYEISANIFPDSYLSHYSAVVAWGITEQIPKTVYITVEQSNSPAKSGGGVLAQKAIDAAFRKPQRQSETQVNYIDYRIVLLRGKHTKKMGVGEIDVTGSAPFKVTDIERTLIDIAVRPAYSGGVFEVLKAYRQAKERYKVSVNRLSGYLTKINYLYPYHQSIGFYMERAGNYPDKLLDLLRSRPLELDFYLTYEMGEMAYSKEWRLYYPKGMD